MEAKWPFFAITIGLVIAVGYTLSKFERSSIINNWSDRRCDLSILFAAAFFKPDNDTRSPSEFAVANFEFCMKPFIDTFLSAMMAPIEVLLDKHAGVAGNSINTLNAIRNITQTMYSALSGYIDRFYHRLCGVHL